MPQGRVLFNTDRWAMTYASMGVGKRIPNPGAYEQLLNEKLPLASGTPLSAVTRTGAIATNCPMLTYLDCAIDNLSALQPLQRLLTVNAEFSEINDVKWLVEQLPMLQHLIVRGDVARGGETPPTYASGSVAHFPRGKSRSLCQESSLVLNGKIRLCGAVVPGTWYQSQPQQYAGGNPDAPSPPSESTMSDPAPWYAPYMFAPSLPSNEFFTS